VRRYDVPVVRASSTALPLRDASFDSVVCIGAAGRPAAGDSVLGELERVLRPGGLLVLGVLEAAPDGEGASDSPAPPADGPRDGLVAAWRASGFVVQDDTHLVGNERLIALRKGVAPPATESPAPALPSRESGGGGHG
jgi:SAM-dependent methyltransferase